jgi:CubicO group peptidase (beta-lactamase class C family)
MSASLPTGEPAAAGVSAAGLARIDAMLGELIDTGVLPGAVALVARQGKVIHRSAQGMKHLERREPLTEETIFAIF